MTFKVFWLLWICSLSLFAGLVEGEKRNYDAGITLAQKKDIAFILKTLANSSLTHIWKNKAALEKAGDRVDPVHPLQFFCYIFQEEELKVALRSLKKRGGWVTNEFFSNSFESLAREHKLNNLTYEYVCDFACMLTIDPDSIYPHIVAERWEDLIDTLILLLPRSGDTDRYDM